MKFESECGKQEILVVKNISQNVNWLNDMSFKNAISFKNQIGLRNIKRTDASIQWPGEYTYLCKKQSQEKPNELYVIVIKICN